MIELLHRFIIPAAYSLLPPAMASDRATAMLLAIALQESRAKHRKQTGGPARSFWQFERIGVAGVLGHKSSREPITAAIAALCEQPTIEGCHSAITHNDVLAACFARCLLYTVPDGLPSPLETDRAWGQYLQSWRPGKPKPATWKANYTQAWQVVSAARSTNRSAEMATDPQQVIAQLLGEGYFTRVAQGDTRAASLWARLVADRLNPARLTSEPGWLKKGGGHSVDGYAEDAICLNADPSDVMNVVDLVSGAGAPGARPVWNGPLPRRDVDKWEAPKTLSEAELAYLKGGSSPQPQPTGRVPDYEAIGGDRVFWDRVGTPLEQDYRAAGQTLNAGSAVWFARPIYDAMREMVANGTEPQRALDAAIAKHRPDWRAVLKLPPL